MVKWELSSSKAFPWIDYVVHGEAEESFPLLLRQIIFVENNGEIPGVFSAMQVK